MSAGSYALKLPASLKREAQRLAKQDGVSLNHWISVAVAQQVAATETAADFFRRRADGASRNDMLAVLAKVPDRPPLAGDELPERDPPERGPAERD
ncbi:MAG: pilus assembly protein HicB [Bosea sp. (in: a-proteobacteria)]|uniref:pilus assembly protein HicB n=1 Tax=Bosea sp. (in: a-proteobacteria) TaxID=1871050 RepID=UPI002734405F|nr:pilus assembly protein HicB [Bosea sp. (in: a-proteobacteria)]MDP3254641.1 pilus assembly protein HicB [Bosea sp. (in: a-proteobacteria)]MDP3320869.1 pilus assembly protein HicB [Bosea sp. (in: a-proteobacteria)]